MVMPAIAYGGCTDTVRESALEVDSGRKTPCRTEDSNSANVRLIDDGPLLSFQGRSSSASSFHASLRWRKVLSLVCVPSGSVSSSSTLQIFREANHLRWLLCPPVYLLNHFPSFRHVLGSTSTGVFQGGCQPLTHYSLEKTTVDLKT